MPAPTARSASVARFRIARRLDTKSADRYRRRVRSTLEGGRAVVIHFPAGSFVDTEGLSTLVGLADLGREIHETESVAVASGSREVSQLIGLTRLDRYLPVFDHPDAAATWLLVRGCAHAVTLSENYNK